MIKFKLQLSVLLIFTLLITSCVSKKKFVNTENERLSCVERELLLNEQKTALNKQIEFLKKKIRLLEDDTTALYAQIREFENKVKEYDLMITSNLSEKEKLNLQLKKKNDDLREREKKII